MDLITNALKLRSGVRQPTGVTVYSLSELLENLLANIASALVDSQWWHVIHLGAGAAQLALLTFRSQPWRRRHSCHSWAPWADMKRSLGSKQVLLRKAAWLPWEKKL